MCMYPYIYVCVWECMHIHAYMHILICRYVCMYVCMYVCIYIYIYIYIYILAHFQSTKALQPLIGCTFFIIQKKILWTRRDNVTEATQCGWLLMNTEKCIFYFLMLTTILKNYHSYSSKLLKQKPLFLKESTTHTIWSRKRHAATPPHPWVHAS